MFDFNMTKSEAILVNIRYSAIFTSIASDLVILKSNIYIYTCYNILLYYSIQL